MIDQTTIAKLRELEKAATPGPINKEHLWAVLRYGRKNDIYFEETEKNKAQLCMDECDVEFIAEMRNALPALLDEIERLKKIIAKELSENDELGSEFTFVTALKEENARLREALEFYANEKNWKTIEVDLWTTESYPGPAHDNGERAREALEDTCYHEEMDEDGEFRRCTKCGYLEKY